MKKRTLSLLLALLMLVSIFPADKTYAVETENEISVWYFNPVAEAKEEAGTVALYRGGDVCLSAILRDDISGDVQWQIEAGQDFWVDIQGGTTEDLRVSFGMVKSLLKDNAVRMRCVLSANDGLFYSKPFTVVVTDEDTRPLVSTFAMERDPIAPDPLPAPTAVANPVEETKPIVTEEAEPAVTEETESAATKETEPAATKETEPAVTEEAEPVVTEEAEPVVTEETGPAATEETAIASTVPVQAPQMPSSASAPPVTANSEPTNEDVSIHTITIEYVYAASSKYDGQRVALPYIAQVAEGGTLNVTVNSPICVGYTPDVSSIDLSKLDPITSNQNFTVSYSPAEVSYTVRHYQQNINDDEYTPVETTLATGKTEALTSDAAAKDYTGFTALTHYHEEIAANSSTMIDIYYDRNYYLMSFDLEGGHGVAAVYARYGAALSVSDPQKAGYSFKAWSLDGTSETTLPDTMPAGNQSYTALWTAGNTSYTVAYWLENPDADNKYNFVGSASASANSGDIVSGSDSAVANRVFTSAERQYYSYNSDLTDTNITVAGDGSAVVNVYYDRNEYTLKFYYARLEGTTYDIANNTNNSGADGGTAASASWVGNFSNKPTLDSKYTEQYETISGNTYYYFTITAKYGASLSELWPNAPLTSAGDYNFISWGTHYGSGYYKANDNKNIKGVYSIMDSNLLIDPSITADLGVNHWLVGYWNTNPTMYTYEIYYTLLAGETAERTYNGVGYKKGAKYTVGSTDYPSGQTALSFEGVTSVGKDYNSNNKEDGTVVRFYYQRNEHTVTLDDNYGNKTTHTIPYGGTISSYMTTVPTPPYPGELPDGAYQFDGWYQTKEGIGALDTSIPMPNEDLIYYAKWSEKTYTISVYLDDSEEAEMLDPQTVAYGSKATKPTDPQKENSTFVGWYYLDESKEEQRFDFDNMTITQDMTIYAKWRSNVMKKVTVRYVIQDENGAQTEIADTETLMLRVGSTRTFEAKTGMSLYEQYRTGCFPTTTSHSITPTVDAEEFAYDFVYVKYEAVPYNVEYKVMTADGKLRAAFKENEDGTCTFVTEDEYQTDPSYKEYVKENGQNDKAVVTELYIPENLQDENWALPDDYVPNALKIQKVIVPGKDNTYNDANTITFIYRYAPTEALYTVNHYVQNTSDTAKYDLYSFTEYSGTIGETVSASPVSIPGYTYSTLVTESMMADGNILTDDAMSGTVNTNDSLELNFYYTVNSYPYQVMYLEKDTNRVLAPAKTTGVDGNQLTALYGSKVTENAKTIDGYDVDANSKSIFIQQEAADTANINTITFYYTHKSADLIIIKTVAMDEEQAEQEGISSLPDWVLNQEFEFVVTAKKGFLKSVYDYTITEGDNVAQTGKVVANTFAMDPIKLKGGQKLTIHDLAMSEYTVTENHVVGFRTTVDNTIQLAHDVKLETAEQDVQVDFVNTYPFYTGDLVIKKEVVKQATTDPDGTYRVKITLMPANEAREIDRVITFVNSQDQPYLDEAGNNMTYTVPKLSEDSPTAFEIYVDVPAGDEVKLVGVPAGTFTAEEILTGTTGAITDYYDVRHKVAVHKNDETKSSNGASLTSEIHGGHPTAVTFTNTYKKGTLTINKTVTQEYENDDWQSDTFTFSITGTTELPDTTTDKVYQVTVGEFETPNATATVENGKVTVKMNGNDPTIAIAKTDNPAPWSESLTITGLPAGYYTVEEVSSTGGLENYTVSPETHENLLVNSETPTVAEFTNTYKRHHANLTIKTICSDPTQSFIFDVCAKDTADGDIRLQVVLVGSDFQTIKDLPVGTYTVTEQNPWSWREAEVNSQEVSLTTEDKTVAFDFGVVDRIHWLSGYSHNQCKKGGS